MKQSMGIPEHRKWMYKRLLPNRAGMRTEFVSGVKNFIEQAIRQPEFTDNGGKLRCPCSKHRNIDFLTPGEVTLDLYKHGFQPSYWCWDSHGESSLSSSSRNANNVNRESTCNQPSSFESQRNNYEAMIVDAIRPENLDQFEPQQEEPPNREAKLFYDLLQSAQRPLWEGCDTHSELSMAVELLTIKSEGNMSQKGFDKLLKTMKKGMPKDNCLVPNFYYAKKLVSKLEMESKVIDCCINGCMLYYKDYEMAKECRFCHAPRYRVGKGGKVLALKSMHYLPITPRLKRLYASENSARHMRWHYEHQQVEGVLEHPSDAEAWKHFDQKYPEFASESRNVRLGLCSDGFTPFGQSASPYSCWPVIVTPYNLPPWMCMSTPYLFLTMIIPGRRNPKSKIDVYLQPLIDELKSLWDEGALTYDVSKKQNFVMRAALMWTINDFPAYGMLSGWMTAGKMACPCCMHHTKAFRLENGGKSSWFDCQRKFLPSDHPFRRNKDGFYKNRVVRSEPPPRLTGEQVWNEVRTMPMIMDNIDEVRIPGYGDKHNWKKRSIFWELPYWSTNLIRHNLDVMHIEKNVFDNVFNTVMDIKGKTKDNIKARMDLKLYCKRKDLELLEHSNGRTIKPKANYTFTLEQKRAICEWVKCLKMPDGYASNLARCVDMKEGKLHGMKSHDCHVFMERLLPIAFSSLPDQTWKAITELSQFFRDLCSTSVRVDDLISLEKNIPIVICKLERIFPPGFFDSMEHLPIHLPYEARVGGPVQYRWMYPFERYYFHAP